VVCSQAAPDTAPSRVVPRIASTCHESNAIVPGTQHKVGAARALEISYKFNLVQAAEAQGNLFQA
jgi:hypothetical protein